MSCACALRTRSAASRTPAPNCPVVCLTVKPVGEPDAGDRHEFHHCLSRRADNLARGRKWIDMLRSAPSQSLGSPVHVHEGSTAERVSVQRLRMVDPVRLSRLEALPIGDGNAVVIGRHENPVAHCIGRSRRSARPVIALANREIGYGSALADPHLFPPRSVVGQKQLERRNHQYRVHDGSELGPTIHSAAVARLEEEIVLIKKAQSAHRHREHDHLRSGAGATVAASKKGRGRRFR